MAQTQTQTGVNGSKFQDKEKPMEVRRSNITAAKGFYSLNFIFLILGVADAIRTSLGPKGMDKMIQTEKTTIITNDGATILKHMAVLHPAARMVFSCHTGILICSW